MRDNLEVEFVGGPYDGHHHQIDVDREPVFYRVHLPANPRVLQSATADNAQEILQDEALATYTLQLTGGNVVYRFSQFTPKSQVRRRRARQRKLAARSGSKRR